MPYSVPPHRPPPPDLPRCPVSFPALIMSRFFVLAPVAVASCGGRFVAVSPVSPVALVAPGALSIAAEVTVQLGEDAAEVDRAAAFAWSGFGSLRVKSGATLSAAGGPRTNERRISRWTLPARKTTAPKHNLTFPKIRHGFLTPTLTSSAPAPRRLKLAHALPLDHSRTACDEPAPQSGAR